MFLTTRASQNVYRIVPRYFPTHFSLPADRQKAQNGHWKQLTNLGGEADRINEAKLIDGVAARGKKVLDQGCQMARVFSNQKISI
jgi:hypothetical protein